jgi:hypothetical protein
MALSARLFLTLIITVFLASCVVKPKQDEPASPPATETPAASPPSGISVDTLKTTSENESVENPPVKEEEPDNAGKVSKHHHVPKPQLDTMAVN